MKKIKATWKKIRPLAEASFVVSGAGLVINNIVNYWLLAGGLTRMELAMAALTSAVIFFAVVAVGNAILLKSYREACFKAGEKPLSVFKAGAITALMVCILASVLDYLFFSLVDNSFSEAYAYTLASFMPDQGREETLASFSKMSPFLQNFVQNYLAIILASFLASAIGKSLAHEPEYNL